MEILDTQSFLNAIEVKYPKSTEKIDSNFANGLISDITEYLIERVSRNRFIIVRNELKKLSQLSLDGIDAGSFHNRLERLLSISTSETNLNGSSGNIFRLEKQIRDLRSIITSPNTIERRIEELQEQVEDLKAEKVTLTEKQDDMLQKFLQSEKKSFIIMPFQREFDNVWLGAIKTACSELHYAPLRVDEINLSSLITDDIEKYSTLADVVIVDLTGNNPNVMFELGWSLAKNKKPIVICQGEHTSKVAFDVRGIRYISYENSWLGIEALKKKIKDFMLSTEKQISAKPKKKKTRKK